MIFHGFQLEDPQFIENVEGEDAWIVFFKKRLLGIEKILRDKGLMLVDNIVDWIATPAKMSIMLYM